MLKTITYSLLGCLALGIAGCGDVAKLPPEATIGPTPTLPAPRKTLMPTVLIAPAKGWPDGEKPRAAAGTAVSAFATGLDHPRWLYVLPNGDVLVAESAAPPKPENGGGIKSWFMQKAMKKAGSAVPSANRITLLRDADGDGVPETRTVFLEGLNSPFGMVLVGNDFYVANCDAILRFRTGRATPHYRRSHQVTTCCRHQSPWTKNRTRSATDKRMRR